MTRAIVVCTWSNEREDTHSAAPELIAAARAAAIALSAPVRWLAINPPDDAPSTAAAHGAAAVHRIAADALRRPSPDAYVAAIAQYCDARSPRLLLLPQAFDARLIAPRVAHRIGAAVVTNALAVAVDDTGGVAVTASAYGGDTHAVYALGDATGVIAMMPGAAEAAPVTSSSAVETTDIAVDLAAVTERVRVAEPARAEGARLEDAGVIVAGGRGLGSAGNFPLVEALADALGGMAAASRPIVDEGWVDSSRQIGLTGKVVRPSLYIAVGVSGASQHMAGCSAARTIVAINRDRDAAIFRHARFGIVGDCIEIMPELIRAAREA